MRTKYVRSTALTLELSKWLLCAILASFMVSAGGCKQEPDSGATSLKTRRLLSGRPPYHAFDSKDYLSERTELIGSASPFAADQKDIESCSKVLQGWDDESAPKRFWEAIDSQTSVESILLIYEVGGTDSYHYWCGALVATPEGVMAVSSEVNRPSDLSWRRIDDAEAMSIMSYLEDTVRITALTPEICHDIVDAPLAILLVYVSDRRSAFISNCVDDACCPQASRVLPWVNWVFHAGKN